MKQIANVLLGLVVAFVVLVAFFFLITMPPSADWAEVSPGETVIIDDVELSFNDFSDSDWIGFAVNIGSHPDYPDAPLMSRALSAPKSWFDISRSHIFWTRLKGKINYGPKVLEINNGREVLVKLDGDKVFAAVK